MIPVEDISKGLSERVLDVCRLLLPGGSEYHDEWIVGDIDGAQGKSLKVNLSGQHKGKWRDWANQDHYGDLLDLWRLKRGLSPGEAIQQAKEFLGIIEPEAVKKREYAKAPIVRARPPKPEGEVMEWFEKKRKLTRETVERYKVEIRTENDPALIFPCYSPTGELLNRSYRNIPKEGVDKSVWQDKKCAPCLFGWQALSKDAIQAREVVLCEGQPDCMTLGQWGIPALSVPNGTGMTWLEFEFDNLSIFDRIYLAFDMDDEGREITRKASERLGKGRCWIIELPRKDWNQCLIDGFTVQDAMGWIKEAKQPRMDNVVVAAELAKDVVSSMEKQPKPFTLKIFDIEWEYQRGLYFREKEVTGWTGVSGGGKSTLMNFLTLAAICQNEPIMIASMEVPVVTTVKKITTAGMSMAGWIKTPDNIRKWLNEFGWQIILVDRVGYIKQQHLLDMMTFSFQRYGTTQYVIDSFMRIEGLEEDYPAQGEFLNKLQEFAKRTGGHIHLVVHPGKVKDRKVNALDIKGSSLILNNVDNAVVVHKNMDKHELRMSGNDLPDDYEKMHDTEIVVEKQREGGWTGAFYLKFNPYDFTFAPCSKYNPPKPERKQAPKRQYSPGY